MSSLNPSIIINDDNANSVAPSSEIIQHHKPIFDLAEKLARVKS